MRIGIFIVCLLMSENAWCETTTRDLMRIEQGCRAALLVYTNFTIEQIIGECANVVNTYDGRMPVNKSEDKKK